MLDVPLKERKFWISRLLIFIVSQVLSAFRTPPERNPVHPQLSVVPTKHLPDPTKVPMLKAPSESHPDEAELAHGFLSSPLWARSYMILSMSAGCSTFLLIKPLSLVSTIRDEAPRGSRSMGSAHFRHRSDLLRFSGFRRMPLTSPQAHFQ